MAESRVERGTTGDQARLRRARPRQHGNARAGVLLGATGTIGVFVWGGYDLGWQWTGLSGAVTLWDWLQVLALPVAVGIAPVLLRHRHRLTRRHRQVVASALIAFAALVTAGYLVPLAWTGFTGNTLWDWLELALLPLVVATAALWADRESIRRPHLVAGAILASAFALLAACGYLVPWTWTGFRGNTAWDWIKLLLLPVLVPTVLLPAALERVTGRLAPPDPNSGG